MKHSILYALFSALVTALILALTPTPVHAQSANAPAEVRLVPTSDLNLTTEAGQRQLEQRVVRAAREVCGQASDADPAGKNQIRKCRENAIARASSQGEELVAASERGKAIAIFATAQ